MNWLLPQINPNEVAALQQSLAIGAPAARVLWSRGCRDPEEARKFLKPSLEDLHDPSLLRGMREAAQRLHAAVERREKVLLYGDYDVDGTSSVVILKKAIEIAGGTASYHVPHRLRDGYGMRTDVIEEAAAAGVSLVISVDTGIRAAEVVKRARALGIDVIITDHHLPENELPPALAVLNPNRQDCTYPDKNLCGAGVAFKLVQALFDRLGWTPARKRKMLESFLKLVAIATVADVVPLTGENRIIVRVGLDGLRLVRNPGLRALLDVSGFAEGSSLSVGQVAFRVAPRINAAGRMANASDVIDLFLTDDPARARSLAAELHSLNQERQQTEADIVRSILEECEKTPVTDGQAALVFSAPGWHRGVVGIVASRLVERFHRPVFVFGEEDGAAQGSGRSIPAYHLLEALESMHDLFNRFGGHKQAAGVSLPVERVAEFRDRFNAHARARLRPQDFQPALEIDAAIDFSEMTDQAVAEVLMLAPFGAANPTPIFAVTDAEVASTPAVFKDKHLHVRLRHQGRVLRVKAWNFVDRLGELRTGARIDAALSFEDDPYSASRGYAPWCAVLRDVR